MFFVLFWAVLFGAVSVVGFSTMMLLSSFRAWNLFFVWHGPLSVLGRGRGAVLCCVLWTMSYLRFLLSCLNWHAFPFLISHQVVGAVWHLFFVYMRVPAFVSKSALIVEIVRADFCLLVFRCCSLCGILFGLLGARAIFGAFTLGGYSE